MNLKELKESIDKIENHHKNIENISVLINLKESSIGPRAFSRIKYACLGFDWEENQFRIEPEFDLVKLGNSLNVEKEKICREFNGRKYYACPKCKKKVAKGDKFCKHCSQKMKVY
ncbi:hypothetical protein BFS06_14330 [Clostridium perfringens]|uniref:Putative zinc finger protein n=1 Tax=Clostridium perfringens TaxID=1502 RepID=A0A140GRE7_CLOPF|nr:hypothetical protein [Clostridium perfringens]AMN31106.1 putative zinc finger protein [Clostridium perfringens]TBX14383.1 hypothetical protein BFS06_14330 [Clostridium perfringens]